MDAIILEKNAALSKITALSDDKDKISNLNQMNDKKIIDLEVKLANSEEMIGDLEGHKAEALLSVETLRSENEMSQAKITELSNSISAKTENEKQEALSVVSLLNNEKEHLETVNKELLATEDSLRSKMVTLTSEKERLLLDITSMNQKFASSKAELSSLSAEKNSMLQETQSLTDKMDVLSSEIVNLSDDNKKLAQLKEKNDKEMEILNSEIGSANDKIKDLEAEKIIFMQSIDALSKKNDMTQEMIAEISERISKKEEHVEKLSKQLKHKENEVQAALCTTSSLTKENERLEAVNKELSVNEASLRSTIDNMLCEKKRMQVEIAGLGEKMSTSDVLLSEVTAENKGLLEEKKTLTAKIEVLESEKDAALHQVGLLSADKDQLQNARDEQVKALEANIISATNKLGEQEGKIASLMQSMEMLQSENQTAHGKIEEQLQTISVKTSHVEELMEQVNDMEKEKHEALTAISLLKEEKEKLLSVNKLLSDTEVVLRSTIDTVKSENKQMQLDIANLGENISSSASSLSEVTAEKNALSDEFQSLKSKLDDMTSEKDAALHQVGLLSADKDKLQDMKDKQIITLENDIISAKKKIGELEGVKVVDMQNIEALQSDLRTAQAKISEQSETISAKTKHAVEISKQVEDADKDRVEALSEVSSLTEEKVKLESVIKELSSTEVVLRSKIDSISSEKERLQLDLICLGDKLSLSETLLVDLTAEKKKWLEEKQLLTTEIDTMASEKDAALGQIALLSADNDQLKGLKDDQIKMLETEVISAKNRIGELEGGNVAAMRTVETLRSEHQKELIKMAELSETILARDDRIENLMKEVEEIMTEKQEALSAVSSLTDEKEKMLATKASLSLKIDTLTSEKESLYMNVTSLGEKLSSSNASLCNLTAEKNMWREEKQSLTAKLDLMMSEKDAALAQINLISAGKNQLQDMKDKQIKVLEAEVNSAKNRTGELEEEKVTAMRAVETLRSEKKTAQEQIAELSQTISAKDIHLEKAMKQVEVLQKEKQDALSTVSSRTEEKERCLGKIDSLRNEKERLEHDVTSLGQEIILFETSLSELTAEKNVLREENQSLIAKLDKIILEKDTALDQIAFLSADKNKVQDMNDKIKSLESDVISANNTIKELESDKATAMHSVETLRTENEIAQAELIEDNKRLTSQKVDLETSCENFSMKVESLSTELLQISKEKDNEKKENCKLSEEVSGLKTEIEDLKARMVLTTEKLVTSEKEKDDALNYIEELMNDCEIHEEKNNAYETRIANIINEKTNALAEAERVRQKLSDELTDVRRLLEEAREQSVQEKASNEENVASMRIQLASNKEKMSSHEEEIDLLKESVTSLSAELIEMKKKNTLLVETMERETRRTIDVETKLDDVEMKLRKSDHELHGEKESKEKIKNELSSQNNKLTIEVNSLKEKLVNLENEFAATNSITDEGLASEAKKLKLEISDLQQLLAATNDSVEEARKAAFEAEEELEEKERQLEDAMQMASAYDEAARSAEEKVKELERRINASHTTPEIDSNEELLKEMELLYDEKLKVEDQLKGMELALEKERSDRRASENGIKTQMEKEQQELVKQSETQMEKLRKLLADVQTDLERERSGIQLSSLQRNIRELNEQCQAYEHELQEMKKLTCEMKNDLTCANEERMRVKKELDDLQASKKDLQITLSSIASEKEEAVNSLGNELGKVRMNLSKVESEIISVKQLNAQLQNQSKQFKMHVYAAKKELETDHDLEVSKLKEELANMKINLSRQQTEKYAANKELKETKEQVKRLRNQAKALQDHITREAEGSMNTLRDQLKREQISKENVVKEFNEAKEKFMKSDTSINKLKIEVSDAKDQIHTLKEQLQREHRNRENVKRSYNDAMAKYLKCDKYAKMLEAEVSDVKDQIENRDKQIVELKTDVMALEKASQEARKTVVELESKVNYQDKENAGEVTAYRVEIKKLQQELRGKENDIKEKESRIVQLKSVTLTKDQCKALKKMKKEHNQFESDIIKYKQQLNLAKEEIASLRSGTESVAVNSAEIETLQKVKNALEIKLRKYAAHCKELQEERMNVFEAVKSCAHGNNIGDEDDDIVGAIKCLIKRLSSVEEECEALSSAESRASSYLMELDRLRDDNSTLEKNMTETQDRLGKLLAKESELLSDLKKTNEENKSLKEQRNDLQKMAKSAKKSAGDLESEKTRQVRYLEQENLQLMLDLKKARKDLQNAKAELSALSQGANDGDDITIDLPLLSKTSMDDFLVDKENVPSNLSYEISTSGEASSTKKSPFRNVSKSSKQKSLTPKATAMSLGDRNVDENDENPGECAQS